MLTAFQVLQSNKSGLDSKESYVVIRNSTSFLRVLGGEPKWTLMTATASEDHGRIAVCMERKRLVQSAFRLGLEIETEPTSKRDSSGREYVEICVITRDPGQSEQAFEDENTHLFTRFFEIFDEFDDAGSEARDEMREMYSALAIDDLGSDVYLSDGVWLGSDGSLEDRGR
jgi:hypothetical protein